MRHRLLLLILIASASALAQEEKPNQLSVDLSLLGHGEMRSGGLITPEEEVKGANDAKFLMGRTRLTLGYKRPHIEAKVTAQHKGIWGQQGGGSFNLFEAWAQLSARNGLFVKMGRQVLSYDDERVIGSNDWAMASLSHDVLKLGYEGHGHKAHAILGFNQNAENTGGGTFYTGGAQPYKIMNTFWYHYDLPKVPLGASLIFMNIGMQGGEKDGTDSEAPHNRFQQLLGAYVSYKPEKLSAEASYYHQIGRNEYNAKMDAWMASIKLSYQVCREVKALTGYDYMSGDDYFAVNPPGMIGTVQHKVFKGFNPVYGSHHKFYGMMDFFYVQTYSAGFTPGLQNFYVGASYKPIPKLEVSAAYHYLAITTHLKELNMTLGHDFDVEAGYQILKDARLSVGFSYMKGTSTMAKLKQTDKPDNLKWAWFSLSVSPHLITTKW